MPIALTRNTILLQSFESAARSSLFKHDETNSSAAINGVEVTAANDSIFRTTDE